MQTAENHAANYFMLARLASALNKSIKGCFVERIASLSRSEIAIEFGGEFALKAFMGDESFVFPVTNFAVSPGSQYPFPEAHGKKVLTISAHWQDRSIRISLEDDFTFVINLYGRNGNVLLFQHGEVVKAFRRHENDLKRKLEDYDFENHFNEDQFIALAKETSVTEAIRKLLPALTPRMLSLIFLPENINEAAKELQNLTGFLLEGPVYVSQNKEGEKPQKPVLSLLKLDDLEPVEDIREALQLYARKYFRWLQFGKIYLEAEQKLRKDARLYEQYCESGRKQLQSLDQDKDYRRQADLIMANLSSIPKGVLEVALTDFYTGEPVNLKLKKDLSPQRWAEKLYQKAKNQDIEREKALESLMLNEERLRQALEQLKGLQKINDFKSLKVFVSGLKSGQKEAEILPYRKFSFNGFEILVGKKAESNDRLTFGAAKKDDLFLHAKDAAGSHVIIRNPNKKDIPPDVLEKAASLAAWYSKSRSSGLCPVSYTPRKYVRKPRNAMAGQVILEKEKVVIVPPAPFS
jgi:predicted ribosome quality control (RQC) complex YloA/Tae2 family protein